MSAFWKRAGFSTLILGSFALMSGCGDGLKEYAFEDGRFRVRMPDQPSEARDPELPKAIKKVSLLQRSGSYEVAWHDLPRGKETTEERLDKACDRAVSTLKAREVSRKAITLAGGYPGRDLVAEWPNHKGIVHDRMYLVDDRLYHVLASGPRWWVESSTSRRVLESFALLEE